MKFIMGELFDDKKINSHNIGTGLQKELYRWIVDTRSLLESAETRLAGEGGGQGVFSFPFVAKPLE